MYLSELDQFVTGGISQVSNSIVSGKSFSTTKNGFKFNKNSKDKTLGKTRSP